MKPRYGTVVQHKLSSARKNSVTFPTLDQRATGTIMLFFFFFKGCQLPGANSFPKSDLWWTGGSLFTGTGNFLTSVVNPFQLAFYKSLLGFCLNL